MFDDANLYQNKKEISLETIFDVPGPNASNRGIDTNIGQPIDLQGLLGNGHKADDGLGPAKHSV